MVHAPGADSTRVPAAGTLAAKDSLAIPLDAASDTLRIIAYRCATADGRQCAEVAAWLDGADRSRRLFLTAEPAGGGVEGMLSVRLDGVADVATGRTDTALVRIVEPRSTTLEFTSAKGEDQIALKAVLRGAAAGGSVEWRVEPDTGGPIHSLPLVQPAPGALSVFLVPKPPQRGWNIRPHPASAAQRADRFKRAALAFRIVATARKGGTLYRSAPLVVRQGNIDAIREEYLVFGLAHGPPPVAAFQMQTLRSDGDYPYAAVNPRFDSVFKVLRQRWLAVHPGQWQINGLYRNPGHNLSHVPRGVSSGAVPASWHQYGCAADLQTFPRDRKGAEKEKEATRFWESLHDEAQLLGFDVEALSSGSGPSSGLGHVHVELDCPP
jgi:hypothetical protein